MNVTIFNCKIACPDGMEFRDFIICIACANYLNRQLFMARISIQLVYKAPLSFKVEHELEC
jgi:hypothetical protein